MDDFDALTLALLKKRGQKPKGLDYHHCLILWGVTAALAIIAAIVS